MIQQDGRDIIAGRLRAYRSHIVSYHGHTIYDAGLFILSDRECALLTHLQQAFRAVAAHTGHDDADFFDGDILGDRVKEDID